MVEIIFCIPNSYFVRKVDFREDDKVKKVVHWYYIFGSTFLVDTGEN